eukprot:TRINITY_DN18283_c0_g1_i1.p1 TRINITY_DN18283_c0_g1~~TRINITY_DN18283_c0_g1_i1.p1  ORF type:complete len:450 (+),score=85.93 TRINITY_DN18283_c0_g1_i1:35-1384(+)
MGGEEAHPQRWAMLAMFCVPSMVNGVLFLSTGAVSDLVEKRFDVSAGLVNGCGQVFYLTFLGSLLSGLAVLNREDGLRHATLMAGLLNTAGAAIRVPSTLVSNSHLGFSLIVLSSLISAASQAYFLTVPTLLSAQWFPPSDRGASTAIAGLVNQAGMAVGYFVTRFFVSDNNFDTAMLRINLVTLLCIGSTTVAIYFFFKSGPAGQDVERGDACGDGTPTNLLDVAKHVFEVAKGTLNNRSFTYFLLVFGVNTSVYWSTGLLLDSAMVDGFTSTQIAIAGTVFLTTGIPGMFLGGLFLDWCQRRHHKALILMCLVLSALTMTSLAFALWLKFPTWECYLICGILGLFLGTSQPIFLDLGVLLTPSLNETISCALLFLFATQTGFLLVFVSTFLTSEFSSFKGGFYNNLLSAALLGICALTFTFYKPVPQEQEEVQATTPELPALLVNEG